MPEAANKLVVENAADALELSPLCPLSRRATDISPESCPQELLREYQRLQEDYQRCAKALATAAHDLRTPLSIISGYIELLLCDKLGSLTTKQRGVLGEMQASTARLKNLISDFLTFSALQAGNVQMRFEENNLNDCLSELCGFWSPRFQAKGVAFYFLENQEVKPFPFDCDRVQRMLSNLLENALKFTPAGGTVWLYCEPYMWDRRAVHLPMRPERRKAQVQTPNSVRISVADTGPGIQPEFHQEIFNDFFQLPDGSENGGVGLGLAIVRRLVQAHGGKIWVESEPGSGSKFFILLPLKQG